MENQQILDQIAGLKGRRAYEEKRAAKLGFPNLYAYFEHKLEKKALEADFEAAKLERFRIEKEIARTAKADKKKSCGCC
tara:strand:- start:605 stop:841 length:237 start_codon:yes stop_codon:yes gene_type:complete